jgi:hypothetical protein
MAKGATLTMRLEPNLRIRLEEKAKENWRSLSNEVARRLEQSFLQEDLVAAVRQEVAKINRAHGPVGNGAGLPTSEVSSLIQKSTEEFARKIGLILSD